MKIRLLLFLLFFFVFPKSIYAADQKFSITTDVTYKIGGDGNTTITQIFNATNLTTDFVLDKYSVNSGLTDINGVRAFDPNGAISYQVSSSTSGKEINLTFDHPTIGIQKQYSWTLIFESKEIAQKKGRLWNIYIPKPADFNGLKDFSVGLYVPASFGKEIYVKPAANAISNIWTKNDFTSAGIYAIFDPTNSPESYQSYDFKLNYSLDNQKFYPVTSEITLPPDTTYQKVFLTDISPKPINLTLDPDGNWIAQYQLGPASRVDITASGSVAVFFEPKFKPTISDAFDSYLGPSQYWPVADSKIQKIAQKENTPAKIYGYLVSNLNSQNKNNLTERTGVLAFSDMFVALSRASGIPARALDGYDSQNTLHSWTQFFDYSQKNWVNVDPALGKVSGVNFFNSLDFDHIVLTIHGKNSLTPLAATKFEFNPVDKDLDINLQPKIGIRADVPTQITSGFGSSATIFIENYGPTTYSGEDISLASDQLSFATPKIFSGVMLPYSSKGVKFPISPTGWGESKNAIITLTFENEVRSYNVKIKPVFQNGFLLTVSIAFALGIISIVAQIARGIFLSRQTRKNNLRGKGQEPSK